MPHQSLIHPQLTTSPAPPFQHLPPPDSLQPPATHVPQQTQDAHVHVSTHDDWMHVSASEYFLAALALPEDDSAVPHTHAQTDTPQSAAENEKNLSLSRMTPQNSYVTPGDTQMMLHKTGANDAHDSAQTHGSASGTADTNLDFTLVLPETKFLQHPATPYSILQHPAAPCSTRSQPCADGRFAVFEWQAVYLANR